MACPGSLLRASLLIALVSLASGCGGQGSTATDTDTDTNEDDTGEPTGTDRDGDGLTAEEGDCDDGDASVFPGATEILDDGIDQDCNGHDALTCTGDYDYADAEHCAVITGTLSIVTDLLILDGLHSLTHIGEDLDMVGSAVTSLSLDSLTHIGRNLKIHSNNALTSLSLDSLTEVGGEFRIHFNDSLTSFSLGSLTHVVGALFFWYNKTLCQSQVDALLEALAAQGWSGDRYIGYNADC